MSKNINKKINYHNFVNLPKNSLIPTKFVDKISENKVLYLMINSEEKQKLAVDFLSSEHFYFQENKELFNLIKEQRKQNILDGAFLDYFEIINFTQIENVSKTYPHINNSYINEINSTFANEENFTYYIDKLLELRKLRNLEIFYNESLNAFQNNSKVNWEKSLLDYETFLSENNQADLNNSSYISIAEATEEYTKMLDELLTGNYKKETGLMSGFVNLDKYLNGFKKGQLIILAARPGVGKTALALNIMKNISTTNINNNCVFISLEMPYSELTLRILSSDTKVSLQKVQDITRLNENDISLLINSHYKYQNQNNIRFDDNPSSKINDIIWKLKQIHKNIDGGLSLIVIDYLQLINGGEAVSGNRQNEVAFISRALKMLALELKVPVVALSQLSRSVENREDKRPQLNDLRESGAIEQDADIVIFLSRNIINDKNEQNDNKFSITDVTIAKNRNGQPGRTKLIYEGDTVTFYDFQNNDE